jgi:glutamate/tyrosine decarboxylase-like PLP-dependent enzyme
MFRDVEMGAHYKHDSPYTYFSSDELHLGEISLECSRPGAAAVALWATQQLLPMEHGGEFAGSLDKSLAAAQSLWQQMSASKHYQALMQPQTDIVVYGAMAADAVSASEKAEQIFTKAAEQELHLALIELPVNMVTPYWPELEINRQTVRCLRSSLMKPEHLDWLDSIVTTLEDVAE